MSRLDRTRKVRLRLYDVTFDQALAALAALYGDREICLLGVHTADGIAHIGPSIYENPEGPVTLLYDVRDFTTRFLDANNSTPRLSYNGLFNSQLPARSPTTTPASLSRAAWIDTLVRVIQETVVPDSWRDNGGDLGSIREVYGTLLITQSPEAHRKIQRVLKNLRKIRAAIDRGDAPKSEGVDLLKDLP